MLNGNEKVLKGDGKAVNGDGKAEKGNGKVLKGNCEALNEDGKAVKAWRWGAEEPPHGLPMPLQHFPSLFNASVKLLTLLIALQCFWINLFFSSSYKAFMSPFSASHWHLKTFHWQNSSSLPFTPLHRPSPPSYPIAIYNSFHHHLPPPHPFNGFPSPFNVPLASLHHPLMHFHQPLTLFIPPLMPSRRALISLCHASPSPLRRL